MEQHMVQILDGIFLGDIQVGFNIGAKFLATLSSFFVQASKLPLQDWQISHVVTLDIAKPCLSPSIQHLFIPITDEENSNLLGELPKVVSFVQTSLDKGSSTLIHCRHGVSRSAAAVVAVLMSKGWSRPPSDLLTPPPGPRPRENLPLLGQHKQKVAS